MNASQVETVEISDTALDAVSGGLTVNTLNTLVNTVDDTFPVTQLAGTVVGTVEDITGLNTAPVTGLVRNL